ncbi:hypothetical protein KSF78_0003381 [Schistosoma japonicum]|nr:hypothetical protein KSF78_0003381 [Schistosoma japonicum]
MFQNPAWIRMSPTSNRKIYRKKCDYYLASATNNLIPKNQGNSIVLALNLCVQPIRIITVKYERCGKECRWSPMALNGCSYMSQINRTYKSLPQDGNLVG